MHVLRNLQFCHVLLARNVINRKEKHLGWGGGGGGGVGSRVPTNRPHAGEGPSVRVVSGVVTSRAMGRQEQKERERGNEQLSGA